MLGCAPPPPPQDCYAAGTCKVPAASGSLLHKPLITHYVHDTTNPSKACARNCVMTRWAVR